MENTVNSWITCEDCNGFGKKNRKFKKKSKQQIDKELEDFEKARLEGKSILNLLVQIAMVQVCFPMQVTQLQIQQHSLM